MVKAQKLKSGKYRIRVLIGVDSDGKRHYKSITADTKREAEQKAIDFQFEMKNQAELKEKGPTVGKAVEQYIISKNAVLSPSTVKGYYVILNQYIPPIADLYINDITQHDIQVWLNDLARTHSPKSCRNAHGLLSAILRELRPDFTLKTRLPQKRKKEIYVPDENEVEEIAKRVEGDRMEIPFLLATQCGLRASEIAALEHKHILVDAIKIEQARVDGINGPQTKQPKSSAGYRTIPISQDLANRLLAIKPDNDGRICPYNSNDISSAWSKLRTKLGIDPNCNFHALRHHYASKCLLMQMPQKYIAELMGHGSLDMIEKVYQHTFPSAMREFQDKLRQANEEFMKTVYDRKSAQGDTNVTQNT